MKSCFIICLLCSIALYTTARHKVTKGINSSFCIESSKFYVPLITPIRDDSIKYEDFRIRYRYNSIINSDYGYQRIPLVRGIIDTTLFNEKHFNKSSALDDSYKYALICSPLIVEGEVVKVFNEDTSLASPNFLYPTNIVIKIKDVISSKYENVNAGDYVLGKVSLYGFRKNIVTHIAEYNSFMEFQEYKEKKTYLFVLDKYHYMYNCYSVLMKDQFLRGCADNYCPYAFSLSMLTHEISKDYEDGKITKKMILDFLRK